MPTKRRVAVAVAVALAGAALAATGCAAAGDPPAQQPGAAPSGAAEADPPEDAGSQEAVLRVVATVAPLADLVEQVGGERVEVATLVPPGADSHTYEPRPSDVAAIEGADAYLGIGLALNDAALELAEATVSDGVPVVRLGEEVYGDEQLVFDHSHGEDDGDLGHSHADDDGDHGHSHGEDDGDHGHSHSDDDGGPGPNPHVWTSVRGAADLVTGIAETLEALDADGADHYRERSERELDELDELDDAIDVATATIPEEARTLVTFHDAWAYFARDYDLEFATAVQPADLTEPSASEVRAVIDLVRELDVPAVFGSEVFPSRVLEAIASETDATYVDDLADDVLPGQPGDPEHAYLELMRGNAEAIVVGLGGDASALTVP